jgi:hypothetical protein
MQTSGFLRNCKICQAFIANGDVCSRCSEYMLGMLANREFPDLDKIRKKIRGEVIRKAKAENESRCKSLLSEAETTLCDKCRQNYESINWKIKRTVVNYLHWWDKYGSENKTPQTSAESKDFEEEAMSRYKCDDRFWNRANTLVSRHCFLLKIF